MLKQVLKALLQEQELAALVDRYLTAKEAKSESTAAARYAQYAARLMAQRFVLPVAGVQGSGKSTLLNAMAFDTPVLPVDADETTCVPVEVVWASPPSDQATVILKEGQTVHVPATEESLKNYVHNEHNPGNKKQVDRIVLESDTSLFKPGLVLVDLPGTGSLTAANMETTRRYLDEAVGVIFMLRTVPPLTRSESVFVALQWVRLPTAFFVQNRWTDETDEEVNNGREHNINTLEDIAKRNRIPLDGKPEVAVVNAYQGMQGSLCPDQQLLETSGLLSFSATLEEAGRRWPEAMQQGITAVLEMELSQTLETIEVQLKHLSATTAELEAKMESEKQRFAKYITNLHNKAASAQQEAGDLVNRQKDWLAGWVDQNRSVLRNKMRTKMRMGIVDGPRLEQAMCDEQSEVADDAFAEVQEAILVFQDELREKFRDISAWSTEKNVNFQTVSRPESKKWENLASPLLGAGGGLGGAYGGGVAVMAIAAAAANSAKFATLGTIGGPVGIAIGAIVGGIIGGLFGAWAGNKTRRVVIGRRAKAVESEVFSAIDGFVESMSKSLLDQVKAFQKKIGDFLSSWEKEQVARFEREQSKTLEVLGESREEREHQKSKLQHDFDKITKYQSLMNKESI